MPFKYSCFISHRAVKGKLAGGIIKDLCEALSDEIELLLEEEVRQIYLDDKRLKGGDILDEELAEALCHSICMIAVITPTYFSKTHPYCAQEYRGMEIIEGERQKLLPSIKKHGIIIPIIIRGVELLPPTIRKKRKYYNFEAFGPKGRQKITRPRGYFEAIRDIAEYIAERYRELNALNQDPSNTCSKFVFPNNEEIRKWLEEIAVAPAEEQNQ